MKVVHISTMKAGGAGRAAFRIHEALLKHGIQSAFVSLDTLNKEQISEIAKEFVYNCHYLDKVANKIRFRLRKHLGVEWNKEKRIQYQYNKLVSRFQRNCEISTLPFSSYDLHKLKEVKEADIIHLHWVAGFIDYATFFKENEKPVVWTLHDMNPFQGVFHYKEDEDSNAHVAGKMDKLVRNYKREKIKKMKGSLTVIAPSKWLMYAANDRKFYRGEVSKISYALDLKTFIPVIDTQFRAKHSIPEKNTVFLFVAQDVNNRRKGFDILIDSLSKIKYKNVTALVVGSGTTTKLDGLDYRFLGEMKTEEKIRYYYSNVDAFILPSREDNLPNVMLEALACGTPVIAFATGGVMEHVQDYKTGLLAKTINSGSLAEIINEFCLNKNRFNRNSIREYALGAFNEKKIGQAYEDVYVDISQNDNVASGGKSSTCDFQDKKEMTKVQGI